MKTNNIFDYMDHDSKNLDETTVYRQTGVKTENVKNLTLEKIHSAKGKKHISKKFVITLAAAVAAAVLGVATVGAAGVFTPAFSERFAGESKDGIYSGGNVRISSNENINAEFAGVIGDSHHAIAAVRLTKKDGSAFTDDCSNMFIDDYDMIDCTKYGYVGIGDNTGQGMDYTQISVTRSLYDDIMTGDNDEASAEAKYFFADDHTIIAYIFYNRSTNIKGQRMTVSQNEIAMYRRDRMIYDVADENTEEDDTAAIAKTISEEQKTLADHQVIREEGSGKYYVADKSKVAIDLNLSFDLNYRDSDREMVMSDHKLALQCRADDTFKVSEDTESSDIGISVTSVKATSLEMEMKLTINGDLTPYSDIRIVTLNKGIQHIADNVTVTLTNGRQICGQLQSWYNTDDEKEYTFHLIYAENNDYDNSDWITLDTAEIASIQIDGCVIAN